MPQNLLSNKYKDRTPMDTVNLIKSFFEDKGFKISHTMFQTEIGTWTCRVTITSCNLEVLGSNGKGMTQEFALASGYSELFERFCNKVGYINNPYFQRKISALRPEYTYCPEEVTIDPVTMVTENHILDKYYRTYLKNEANMKKFFQINYPDGAKGVPFTSIFDSKDVKLLDPSIMQRATGSNGMAAGNTLEEALNQGLSELYERRGTVLFYSQPQTEYHVVDLGTITRPDFKEAVSNILNREFDFIVVDLSKSFGIPVLAGILIDTIGLNCRVNFSAFPVFDIAFERILTELYQGIENMRQFCSGFETPAKGRKASFVLNDYGNNYSQASYIHDEYITQKCVLHSYDELANHSDVFLAPDHNNTSILDFYRDLTKKLGFNFYYYNCSPITDMAAVYILGPDFCSIEQIREQNAKHISPLVLDALLLMFGSMQNLTTNICDLVNHIGDDEYYGKLYSEYRNFETISANTNDYEHFGDLILSTYDSCLFVGDGISPMFSTVQMLNNPGGMIATVSSKSYLYGVQKLYASILIYKSNGYSVEEIKEIFKALYGTELTYQQIEDVPNMDIALMDCYFYPTSAFYNSDIYDNIVKAYFNIVENKEG